MVKGFLGKAFSLAAVAAISLPLIAVGQAYDVVPGGIQSSHYFDAAQVQILDEPIEAQSQYPVVTVQHFQEYDRASIDNAAPADTATDTNISGGEALISYTASAAFSGVGIGMAAWQDKDKKLSSSLRNDGHNLMAITGAAGEVMRVSNNLSVMGSLTDSKSTKNAGAAMAVVALGIMATIPPYLVTQSVRYNFFNGQEKPSIPVRHQHPIIA